MRDVGIIALILGVIAAQAHEYIHGPTPVFRAIGLLCAVLLVVLTLFAQATKK